MGFFGLFRPKGTKKWYVYIDNEITGEYLHAQIITYPNGYMTIRESYYEGGWFDEKPIVKMFPTKKLFAEMLTKLKYTLSDKKLLMNRYIIYNNILDNTKQKTKKNKENELKELLKEEFEE